MIQPFSTDEFLHSLIFSNYLSMQSEHYDIVLADLKAGRKLNWSWSIFPHLRGVSQNLAAQHFGLSTRKDAEAYFAHPVLGKRLLTATASVISINSRTASQIFGVPGAVDFQSSMTLFALAVGHQPEFSQALDKYFSSLMHEPTVKALSRIEHEQRS